MATNTGTLTLTNLLEERFQSADSFGLNTILDILRRDLDAHRRQMEDLFSAYAARSKDRQRIAGGVTSGEMVPVDETGTAPTQVTGAGATVGFPLEAFQWNLGWSRRWLRKHTPSEMAEQVIAGERAHVRAMIRDLKIAIYTPTNRTVRDRLDVPQIDLLVKAFTNADSFPIPTGASGEAFDEATHQHYTAAAALAVADVLAAINTVVEHGHGNTVIVAINVANEAAFRALTGFVPFSRSDIIPATTADAANPNLDISRINDRPIGFLGAATIWVKPWAIAGYAVVTDIGDTQKPLVLRTEDGGAPGLELMSEFELYPLQARYMEGAWGFGAWTRTNGAVHQFTNATYQTPTIT